MLNYIWFSIFILASVWCAWAHVKSENDEHEEDYQGRYLLLSMSATSFAVYLVWDSTGKPLFKFLMQNLPDAGSAIQLITALTLTGFACAVFVAAVNLSVLMTFEKLASSKIKQG